MNHQINQKIEEVQQQTGATILAAIESGSRAWGFASPDSDYDVRLMYTFPKEQYLRIENIREDLNLPIDENLIDLSGWEIRKTLRLVLNGNASPFEWVQSPIVYYQKDHFLTELQELLNHHVRPKKLLFHYLGLTKGTWFKYLQEEQVNLKKYFYALRPILCALWVWEYRNAPPIQFKEVRKVLRDVSVNRMIDQLLDEKVQAAEDHMIKPNKIIHAFIVKHINEMTDITKKMDDEPLDDRLLNDFLLKWMS